MEIPFIQDAIDKISGKVTSLVGISGTIFSSSGMFLPILKIVALIVVVYAFYQLVWKRSFISSFGEMFKFVVVLTVALLLFGNYNLFLTNVNKLSDEVGGFIVGATTDSTFNQTLWSHFVDKPYLTLQYGTDDVESIGDGSSDLGVERIKLLLKARTGSDERANVVSYEANELENYYMTYDSVNEKTALNVIFLFLNIITLIPFFVIAMAIIFTQFWFVIIAIFAPFALLIASFPSQFGVLKRYFFELALPLMVKIGLHFVLVMILLLTSLVAEFEVDNLSNMIDGHIGKAFLNGLFYAMLFLGVFILRKRITGMLASGSELMGEIREGMRATTTKPVQSGIQTTTTVAGAGIGLAVGGLAGMAHGANVGGTAGKVLSGQSDGIAGATQDIGRVAYQHHMMTKTGGKQDKNQVTQQPKQQQEKLTPEQRKAKERERIEYEENKERGIEDFKQFASDLGMSERERDMLAEELHSQGVDFSKIDIDTLEQHDIRGTDASGNVIKGKSLKDPKGFAQSIKEEQDLNAELEEINKFRRTEEFNDFMKKQNMTQAEINEVHKHLESKAIEVSSIPRTDYEDADKEIRARLEDGESISYTEEFKHALEHKAMERKIQEERDRILDDDDK